MIVERAIFNRLSTTAAVSALVGDRIYPAAAPQDADPPYITFQRISAKHERHLGGTATLTVGRWQVDCWAASVYETAKAIADAVRLALDGFRGAMGVSPNDVDVRRIEMMGGIDQYTPPRDATELGTHRVSMDFEISYNEPTS